ncbi:DNA sulfur modification protein DndD [Bacillus salitolerans]|uniref:Nuclease SbcCD subunit C n=1 Tax=Bacillus salitolerans TaxID=1437434 RepID=A0ABW4LY58_9BACI
MLIKRLIFDNYKTYYGHQEINFYIPVHEREEKNIILLGGLNGAGKTTILKAILYILYGERGISKEEKQKIFSNVINNTFFDEGGRDCSSTLVIETDKGEDWEIQVKWSFDNYKRLISESRELTVRKAGNQHGRKIKIDNIESYNHIIDKIIPYYASPFFIFDGEEVKEIILRQNSAEMKEAIHKITGMDAYKQLIDDLNQIKSNIEQTLSKAVSKSKLNNIKTELEVIEKEIDSLELKKNKALEESQHLEKLIGKAKSDRNEKITKNSKSREVIIKEQSKISTELKIACAEFENYYRENIITIILNTQLAKLKKQLKLEHDIQLKQTVQEASLKPYKNFIEQLLNTPIEPALNNSQLIQIKKIGEEIWIKENDIKQIVPHDFVERHDISNKDYNFITNLQLKDKHHVVTLINKIEKLKKSLEALETEIRNAPESVDITEENERIDILSAKCGEKNLIYKNHSKKLSTAKDKRAALLNQFTRLSDQHSDYDETKEQLEYVTCTIKAINKYLVEHTVMKANYIKSEFSSILNKLFRKQDEFGKIEFDIETYSIRLYNDRNQEISIQERSAGEMQMISSAFIWALTKASDLSLPMVIDTPLGRLDSYHRNHLINHYYKDLSEQVIILSTDTEITQEYINIMKQNSYKQYMLDYDEDKKYTVIRDGYFNFVRV